MKTHKLFLVVGSFGVGKTTVCSAYPEFTADEYRLRLNAFKNLYIYGFTLRGLDTLQEAKRGLTKPQIVEELRKDSDKNLLLHGTFFQYKTDIFNFSQSHELHVIHLDVDLETNLERLRVRNPKFDEVKTRKRIGQKHREVASFLRSCEEAEGVIVHRVDGTGAAPKVKNAAWKVILKNLTR